MEGLIKELERRKLIYQVFDLTVSRLFVTEGRGKMRRNQVHALIQQATGIRVLQSPMTRKLVIEVLKSKGVKLGHSNGLRWFRGIECRPTTKLTT
jgi:hypothetical protein